MTANAAAITANQHRRDHSEPWIGPTWLIGVVHAEQSFPWH
jgi:hypothetical protein